MRAKKPVSKPIEKPAPKKRGAKSSYDTIDPKKLLPAFIETMARQGLTEPEMAERIGIAHSTFSKWKVQHPTIAEAVIRGKAEPDDKVEASLYKRANGYEYSEIVREQPTQKEIDAALARGEEAPKMVITRIVTKHMPPDTAAAFIWLKNRRSEKWRDKHDLTLPNLYRENREYLTYRIFNRAFDKQQQVLLSKGRDIGLMCGRRSGKTETNKMRAVKEASIKPGQRILIIGLTFKKTQSLYQQDICDMLDEIGITYKLISTTGTLTLDNNSIIQFGGNANKQEQDRFRGFKWDHVIIDEAQSQKGLKQFIEEVIQPMLVDTQGTLTLTGTGPRIPGTYWEAYYKNPSPQGLRLNWNISHNPFIKDFQEALEKERIRLGMSETDSVYLREYLGLPVYDTDALVYRIEPANFYSDKDLSDWIKTQPPTDLHFAAGLDYGFSDADAFAVILYSDHRPEKFLVYEYKGSGMDVTSLIAEIKAGQKVIALNPLFQELDTSFTIYADTSDKKISLELNMRHNIPVIDAMKQDKDFAISTLRAEVNQRWFRIRQDGIFHDEAQKTVFKRVEQEQGPDIIIREIDDDLYHPDLMDAILYALRPYWATHSGDPTPESERPIWPLPAPSMEPQAPSVFDILDKQNNSGAY